MIVQTDVAYVRLDDGSVAKLAAGDTIPDNAAADHVAGLKAAGVLGDTAPAPKEEHDAQVDAPAGGKGRSKAQGS